MKYISTLIAVFLLVLSTTVFAQESEGGQLTLEEFEQLTNAQEQLQVRSNPELPGVQSCTDVVGPDSVRIDINSNSSEFLSGTKMQLSAELMSQTQKTISNGKLYVKILRETSSSEGYLVIDEFVVKDDITISPENTFFIDFDWAIPSVTQTGNYKVAAYVIVDNKFDASGISYLNDVTGGEFDFTVNGEGGSVYLDSNSMTINGESVRMEMVPYTIQQNGEALISIPFINTTEENQNVSINWFIYKDDARDPSNLIRTIKTDATVPFDSEKNLELQLVETEYPVYHIVAELIYKDTKSIAEVRYARNGVPAIAILYSDIASYPIVAGESNTMSVCVHNSGAETNIGNGTVILQLKDLNGKMIESYEYNGIIPSNSAQFSKEFTSPRDIENFTLEIKAMVGGVLSDEFSIDYGCKATNTCSNNMFSNIWVILGGFLTIIILLIIMITIKKNKKIVLPMFSLVLLLSFFVSPSVTEAARTTSVSTTAGDLSAGAYMNQKIENARVTLTNSVDARNNSTNAVINNNASLPIGTQVRIDTGSSVSVSATGASSSTGRSGAGSGQMQSGAGQPTGSGYSMCSGAYVDRHYNYWSSNAYSQARPSSHERKRYATPTVNPPTESITTTGNISCSGDVCTVTGEGAISVRVNFASTYARFYMTDYNTYVNISNGVNGCSLEGTFTPNPTNLAASSVTFNFNGYTPAPPNTAPNPPTISGPTTGNPTTQYTFGFVATDPDGDNIKYGVDWDGNNTVDEWLPSTGDVASGVSRTGVKSWSAVGSKTFKALTQDAAGLQSTWASYTITLSNAPTNGSCGTTNNSCLAGTWVDQADTSSEYLWSCNGLDGGSNASCSLSRSTDGQCSANTYQCLVGDVANTSSTATQFTWDCNGTAGGATVSCTSPRSGDGSFAVSCSAPSILPGQQATFTATTQNGFGPVSYQWKNGSTNIPGATNSTYQEVFNSIGQYRRDIEATDGSSTDSDYCFVTVGCDNSHTEGEEVTACSAGTQDVWTCTSGGWTITNTPCTPEPPDGEFTFDPGIVGDPSDRCGLILEAENVQSCRLVKAGATVTTSPSINDYLVGSNISIDKQVSVPIGRYAVECTGLDGVTTQTIGVKSCILNPDLRES